ncbi:helix-turn-helix transcriptional regulator [Promicromonospora vindobonensis]|uniref:Helix-turn-helix transcriptional regulator n=1 Tax=Promicromonospora vindobonensis TaxID=195748 RepID=A0ABW5VT32_9MICO
MADTSRRTLQLLSLFAARRRWSLGELAARLEVSDRTARRDVETLRRLGYPVTTVRGPAGGYELGAGHPLPPLLFDDEQALAVAVALQTASTSVLGLGDDAARAADTLKQVVPPALRSTMDTLRLTTLRNYWEFPGAPIAPSALRAVGSAVRHRHVLAFDALRADGTRPDPHDADFAPPRRLEPHHLVVWAGRWYLVGYDLADDTWRVHRVDRLHVHTPTATRFAPRAVPGGDVAQLVMTTHDRGDTVSTWECVGTARINLPAETVARWAPGGSVVEHLDTDHSRLTIGAWSWAGVAGILTTFDADLSELEPPELVAAGRRLVQRWGRVSDR